MNLTASFVATMLIVALLIAELWRHRFKAWVMPALVTYVMVLAWYCADLFLDPEKYQGIPPGLLDICCGEVLIFVLTFRAIVPLLERWLAPRTSFRVPLSLNPELLLKACIAAWAVLFVCAISRMEWNVLGALFPIGGRNGELMWARAAAGDAGPTGFLVSTGGYLYLLVCALFGIILVLARKPPAKLGAVAMMLLTWPFFLLCGTRNAFLAVCMPWVFCYGLLGRQRFAVRMATLGVCFIGINFAFQIVIGYRNVGYQAFFQQNKEDVMVEGMTERDTTIRHEGLNMLQELCFENAFLGSGQLGLTWGWDYFVQVTGFIPRVIWANKPMMGIEYAKARGFGGGDGDTGVVATVSAGLIGQGVLEYGPIFGPVVPAVLMALWCSLLARWWRQRASFLRLGLFLLAMGITFNFGRGITNIALWPVAFAYLIVLALEKGMVTRPVLPEGVRFSAKARALRRRQGNVSAPHPAEASVAAAAVAAKDLQLS